MAKFKVFRPISINSNLFESFSALSKDDITDGTIAGIDSPYSVNHKQNISLALLNAEEQAKELSNEISLLYRRIEYGAKIESSKYLEDFDRFSALLLQTLKINEVLYGDEIILKKLACILTYAYVKKNSGEFKIYSNFDAAKQVTSIVFNTAKKLGLDFLTPDLEDLIQKVLFSVLYKEASAKTPKQQKG